MIKSLPLPQHINLLRLSEHTANFKGFLLIKDMQRLVPSLYNDEGKVAVNLTLGTDEEGIRFCRVELKTMVNLQCQRCMEPYNYEIISDSMHGIVNSEAEAGKLSEHYEPVITQEWLLIVQDMVEDDLILKLPIVPMHAVTECRVKLPMTDSSWDKTEDMENPFKVLKLLKQKTKERN